MDVEGKGRVCTRKLAKAHNKTRRRDCFAKAVVLELPLLQPWQHETLRPVALRPRLKQRSRGLSSLTVRSRTAKQGPRADPDVLHKGFGSFRRPFARLPRGGDPGLAGRGPNAAQPELITVSDPYIRAYVLEGKGKRQAIGHCVYWHNIVYNVP